MTPFFTQKMELHRLVELYNRSTKHSSYQMLPSALRSLFKADELITRSRHERERLDFIRSAVDFTDKRVLDIGANTGYFSFEAIDAGAAEVVAYEGNSNHATFVEQAGALTKYHIDVRAESYPFVVDTVNHYDIVLLLNIVHHLGDDYGDAEVDKSDAKAQMLHGVNNLSFNCRTMVFQMGFNWKGNRNDGLFENGTKRELIQYVREGIEGYWTVESVGVAQRRGGIVAYEEVDEHNIERDDALGEFLNRPLFVMKSVRSDS